MGDYSHVRLTHFNYIVLVLHRFSILENKLWKGEDRTLPIERKGFQKKVGWNTNVSVDFITLPRLRAYLFLSQIIFEYLGFTLNQTPSTTGEMSPALFPPITSDGTPQSKQNRAKLLRAWVEISAWLVDYQKRFGDLNTFSWQSLGH